MLRDALFTYVLPAFAPPGLATVVNQTTNFNISLETPVAIGVLLPLYFVLRKQNKKLQALESFSVTSSEGFILIQKKLKTIDKEIISQGENSIELMKIMKTQVERTNRHDMDIDDLADKVE